MEITSQTSPPSCLGTKLFGFSAECPLLTVTYQMEIHSFFSYVLFDIFHPSYLRPFSTLPYINIHIHVHVFTYMYVPICTLTYRHIYTYFFSYYRHTHAISFQLYYQCRHFQITSMHSLAHFKYNLKIFLHLNSQIKHIFYSLFNVHVRNFKTRYIN